MNERNVQLRKGSDILYPKTLAENVTDLQADGSEVKLTDVLNALIDENARVRRQAKMNALFPPCKHKGYLPYGAMPYHTYINGSCIKIRKNYNQYNGGSGSPMFTVNGTAVTLYHISPQVADNLSLNGDLWLNTYDTNYDISTTIESATKTIDADGNYTVALTTEESTDDEVCSVIVPLICGVDTAFDDNGNITTVESNKLFEHPASACGIYDFHMDSLTYGKGLYLQSVEVDSTYRIEVHVWGRVRRKNVQMGTPRHYFKKKWKIYTEGRAFRLNRGQRRRNGAGYSAKVRYRIKSRKGYVSQWKYGVFKAIRSEPGYSMMMTPI